MTPLVEALLQLGALIALGVGIWWRAVTVTEKRLTRTQRKSVKAAEEDTRNRAEKADVGKGDVEDDRAWLRDNLGKLRSPKDR